MSARRLLGKTERELERSALVQEGQLKRRGEIPKTDDDPASVAKVVRYGKGLAELLVGLTAEGAIARLMLVLVDPQKAAKKRDDVFRVTVVGTSGRREPANYATAVRLTFLREALGAPMTQTSELYARLLGGEKSLDWSSARIACASLPNSAGYGESLQVLEVTVM